MTAGSFGLGIGFIIAIVATAIMTHSIISTIGITAGLFYFKGIGFYDD